MKGDMILYQPADSYFDKAFRKHIIKGFSSYGFKKYRSRFIARIVGDSIFQLIGFQKEAYGSKGFTVNIAFLPLYIPYDFLALEPGNRLCSFINENHKWWSFITEEEAEESFKIVSQAINDKIIPMFDIINNSKALIKYYNKKDAFPIEWYHNEAHGLRFLAYLQLREQNYENAVYYFSSASALYNSYHYAPWAKDA